MVQGYRIFDLNILRVAMEDAQKCGHSKLFLTEVNPDTSKVAVFFLLIYHDLLVTSLVNGILTTFIIQG